MKVKTRRQFAAALEKLNHLRRDLTALNKDIIFEELTEVDMMLRLALRLEDPLNRSMRHFMRGT